MLGIFKLKLTKREKVMIFLSLFFSRIKLVAISDLTPLRFIVGLSGILVSIWSMYNYLDYATSLMWECIISFMVYGIVKIATCLMHVNIYLRGLNSFLGIWLWVALLLGSLFADISIGWIFIIPLISEVWMLSEGIVKLTFKDSNG